MSAINHFTAEIKIKVCNLQAQIFSLNKTYFVLMDFAAFIFCYKTTLFGYQDTQGLMKEQNCLDIVFISFN